MKEGVYYLDRDLTLAESTRRFSDGGREIPEEAYYVVAVRRRGHPGWVFRFTRDHHGSLDSIVSTLNRPPGLPLTTERPSPGRGGAAIRAAQTGTAPLTS